MESPPPPGSILGPLLFLIYINDLPLVQNKISTPILFADDTSVIIDELDPSVFQDRFTEVLNILNSWFNVNLLSLNFSKTHYITYTTKNIFKQGDYISVANGIKKIFSSCFTKFLGINIANTLIMEETP
jgi:hypothetical protein